MHDKDTSSQLAEAFSRQFGEAPPVYDDDADSIQGAKLEFGAAPPQPEGNVTVARGVFLLLKAFVGTGILFLPKAFLNGGMIFSIIVLLVVAALSLWSYLLLVRAREHCPRGGSFGDIAEQTMGKYMRFLVQSSVSLSQIGFVCAYMIFIAENLRAFVLNVSHCAAQPPIGVLIVLQLIVFIPFSMIRRIERLGFATIVSEVFILFGLAYIYYYDIKVLVANGMAPSVKAFNAEDFALFIGTAVYSFEGIGLVIPITEAMRHPERFPRVLYITLSVVAVLFISVGALSYAAFGDKTADMVVSNLPQGEPIVSAIQLIYALAIVLSVPLQLFPAITILENGTFGLNRSGKDALKWKWSKNAFRAFLLVICVGISWGGSSNLDKFVSLIGSFACIPLCFIYPPLFHWKSGACGRSYFKFLSNMALAVFGVAVMIYGTWITVKQWAATGPAHDICAAHNMQ